MVEVGWAGAVHLGHAYEPGGGSTIQSYAGICGAQDLQSNSDAMFNAKSLDLILDYAGGGGSLGGCSSNSSVVNANAPTVSAGGPFSIPANTPFELTANTGVDAEDSATLTYSWEQFDVNAATGRLLADGDQSTNPIFRVYLPTDSTTRVFHANALTNGSTPTGELLPTTTRTLNFKVIVRDNNSAGGRVGEASVVVNVDNTEGPFAVTFPNGGETISATQTVTWNELGSSSSAANVDIFLSTDGGATYPITLLTNTTNDGSQSVNLGPNVTTTARIKVKANGGIFFDVSNADFEIDAVPVELSEYSID